VPAIIANGDDDLAYRNVCAICGWNIERCEGDPWGTEEQVDEYIAEMVAENRREYEEGLEEAMHPEWRCPPRE
jgi:hypothetical protein